ncbi:aspartyl-phosphate phosphatase Spo0E family protein [Aquibacillus sediminis]|uniref:aspartyl-phosphate phosphatase Spo0E family protein n=1 Tax=Aquibacillus sediminis TaxID=2574734 RepID=UPI001FEBBBBF|nr:aspartyl-phosphate phosphatase Spo0E family protein [Aquibacillus sediminis]
MGHLSMRERQIEKLRSEMYLSFKKDRYGEEVVNISQKLDDLLNEFIVLPKKK